MTTNTNTMSSGSAELVLVAETLFTDAERAALAGFLAGYSGLTRDAYTLDLRQYTCWCTQHGCTYSVRGGLTSNASAGTWSPRSSEGDHRPRSA